MMDNKNLTLGWAFCLLSPTNPSLVGPATVARGWATGRASRHGISWNKCVIFVMNIIEILMALLKFHLRLLNEVLSFAGETPNAVKL